MSKSSSFFPFLVCRASMYSQCMKEESQQMAASAAAAHEADHGGSFVPDHSHDC